MIEYLEKLVEEKQYEAAIRYAEQMLLGGNCSTKEIVRIYGALTICRLMLGEYYGAVVAGRVCKEAAEEAGDWDTLGLVCRDLGVAYARLGQLQTVIAHYYDFLSHLNQYSRSYEWQALVWFNLGLSYRETGDLNQAVNALTRGLEVAVREGRGRLAHGLRHALAHVLIRLGRLQEVPRLLAQALAYIHRLPRGVDRTQTLLWHHFIRVEFAAQTNRFHRAVQLTQRSLGLASGFPDIQSNLMLVLATVSARQGNNSLAIRHLLSARVFAIQGRRYDLELQASEWMYRLSKEDPASLENLAFPDFTVPGAAEFRGFD